jgi:hypothetical protein
MSQHSHAAVTFDAHIDDVDCDRLLILSHSTFLLCHVLSWVALTHLDTANTVPVFHGKLYAFLLFHGMQRNVYRCAHVRLARSKRVFSVEFV